MGLICANKLFPAPPLQHLGKIAEYKTTFAAGIADSQKDADARKKAADDEQKRLADLRTSAVLLAAKTLKKNLRNPSSADWVALGVAAVPRTYSIEKNRKFGGTWRSRRDSNPRYGFSAV